jgi:hypothetical protein
MVGLIFFSDDSSYSSIDIHEALSTTTEDPDHQIWMLKQTLGQWQACERVRRCTHAPAHHMMLISLCLLLPC